MTSKDPWDFLRKDGDPTIEKSETLAELRAERDKRLRARAPDCAAFASFTARYSQVYGLEITWSTRLRSAINAWSRDLALWSSSDEVIDSVNYLRERRLDQMIQEALRKNPHAVGTCTNCGELVPVTDITVIYLPNPGTESPLWAGPGCPSCAEDLDDQDRG